MNCLKLLTWNYFDKYASRTDRLLFLALLEIIQIMELWTFYLEHFQMSFECFILNTCRRHLSVLFWTFSDVIWVLYIIKLSWMPVVEEILTFKKEKKNTHKSKNRQKNKYVINILPSPQKPQLLLQYFFINGLFNEHWLVLTHSLQLFS